MSQFYVGITDTSWYSLLKEDYLNGKINDKVNFWTPGTKEFKAIEPGEMFLFKLHNKKSTGEKGEIVGGGYFSHYEQMSIPDAWEKYGRGNGRESLQKMQESLKGIQQKNNLQTGFEIGCIILENVFFLDKWIEEPVNWSKSIVSGKRYTTDTEIGVELFNNVNLSLKGQLKSDSEIIDEIEEEIETLQLQGAERVTLVKARVNQSVFRERLLNKYSSCCLCKVHNPSLLIASHIKPWAASESDEKLDVENGFLLCPNHDALFDGGYITFEDDGMISISGRLSCIDRTFTNVQPSMNIQLSEKNKEYLRYHRKHVFR